jgi:hypothetical protein
VNIISFSWLELQPKFHADKKKYEFQERKGSTFLKNQREGSGMAYTPVSLATRESEEGGLWSEAS